MNAEQAADLFSILSAARNSGNIPLISNENVFVTSVVGRRNANAGSGAVDYRVRVVPGPGFDRVGGWAGLASLLDDGDHEVAWTPNLFSDSPCVEVRTWRKYEQCTATLAPGPIKAMERERGGRCVFQENHAGEHETEHGTRFG